MVAVLLLNIAAYDGSAAGSLWVADSSPRWVAAVVLNVSVSRVRSPASLGGLISSSAAMSPRRLLTLNLLGRSHVDLCAVEYLTSV